VIIEFTNEELKHIGDIGAARTGANKNKRDIRDYDHRRFNLTSEQANKLGVMGEAALVKYLGYDILTVGMDTWVSFYTPEEAKYYKKIPDVFHNGQWYDTRRLNKITNPLAIRKKDVEQNVIVLNVFIGYAQDEKFGPIKLDRNENGKTYAVFTGWANAREDWDKGRVPRWSAPDANGEYDSRVVEARPIEELFKGEVMV